MTQAPLVGIIAAEFDADDIPLLECNPDGFISLKGGVIQATDEGWPFIDCRLIIGPDDVKFCLTVDQARDLRAALEFAITRANDSIDEAGTAHGANVDYPETAAVNRRVAGAQMTRPIAQDYMSTPEAAHFLRCSPSYLNKLRLTGGGPIFTKAGSRVIYNRGDLTVWVAERKRRSTSDGG